MRATIEEALHKLIGRVGRESPERLGALMMALFGMAIAIAKKLGRDPDAEYRRLRQKIDDETRRTLS
jgi:hypothetical protein